MRTCYNCDIPLTNKNKSKEHLLQSALGGKEKSTELICNSCNKEFGDTIDAELISQIGFFADLLGINNSTKQKVIKAHTEEGREWSISSKLKGIYCINFDIKGNKFCIKAKDKKSILKQLKKVLRKLNEKDSSIDIEQIVKKIQFEDKLAPSKLFFNNGKSSNKKEMIVGGNKEYYFAIMKIILNFYLAKGGEKKYVLDIINIIKLQPNKNPKRIKAIYSKTLERTMGKDEIGHIVHICSNNKYLYGYIELVGIFRYLTLLNSNYQGSGFNFTWAYDLVTKKEYVPSIGFHVELLKKPYQENTAIEMGLLHDRFMRIVEQKQNIL